MSRIGQSVDCMGHMPTAWDIFRFAWKSIAMNGLLFIVFRMMNIIITLYNGIM